MDKTFIQKLIAVQIALKAPKNQFNKFGGYNYRNAEDILEAVKPLLNREGLLLTMKDHIEQIGDRHYLYATVTVTDGKDSISVISPAREQDEKKGMDASQITGSASSYARKYALNGLFLIDDVKDADYPMSEQPKEKTQQATPTEPSLWEQIKTYAKQSGVTEEQLKEFMKNGLGLSNSDEITKEHWQKARTFINDIRYKS